MFSKVKTLLFHLIFILVVWGQIVSVPKFVCGQVVKPNSQLLVVRNFYDLNPLKKEWENYSLTGFYEKPALPAKGRLSILPRFDLDRANIKFLDANGLQYKHSPNVARKTSSIIIPIRMKQALPSGSQRVAIAKALDGTSIVHLPAILASLPALPPGVELRADIRNQILANQISNAQSIQQLANDTQKKLNEYEIVSSAISQVELEVIVANQIVGRQKFKGTFLTGSNSLPPVEVLRPSIQTKNRISQGNFQVRLYYRFPDFNRRSINAKVEWGKILSNLVNDSRKSIQSSSSSGFRILGFGSKRKNLRHYFEDEVLFSTKEDTVAGTHIVSTDADDGMFRRFERTFLPTLSRSQVIQNHKSAAVKAGNNPKLKKAHKLYAKMLENNDETLEVPAAKAVSALSGKNFIGFLTNGVRFSSSQIKGSGSFQSLSHQHLSKNDRRFWSEVKKVSVEREIVVSVDSVTKEKRKPNIGLVANRFPNTNWATVVGVIADGPSHQAGIVPGSILLKVDGNLIENVKTLTDYVEDSKIGTSVELEFISPLNNQRRKVEVELWRGEPTS